MTLERMSKHSIIKFAKSASQGKQSRCFALGERLRRAISGGRRIQHSGDAGRELVICVTGVVGRTCRSCLLRHKSGHHGDTERTELFYLFSYDLGGNVCAVFILVEGAADQLCFVILSEVRARSDRRSRRICFRLRGYEPLRGDSRSFDSGSQKARSCAQDDKVFMT